MKILFLCHRLPYPPKRGGKIRPFNMIRYLARRHDVTVATLARTRQELEEGAGLSGHCREVHIGRMCAVGGWGRFALHGATTYPATFGYFHSPSLHRKVGSLLAKERFDATMVHSSSMGPYVATRGHGRMIMDFGDADSEKWFEYARSAPFPLSLAFALEGRKVRRYERWLGTRFEVASVNAPREREILAPYVRAPIHVLPNGVDLEYFRPRRETGVPDGTDQIVFTGNMSYRPNVDGVRHFVSEVLPRIWRRRPGARFWIVGMDPSPVVRGLADGDRVIVTGAVEDVRPYFNAAAVAVAPLRVARGLQNKVLEAMAMRVPVVATPAAANGISAVADQDLLVAATPDSFSRAVLSLLDDPANRERYAAAGRRCVEQNHDWERVLARLEALVSGTATARADALTADRS